MRCVARLALIAAFLVGGAAQAEITDPYEILNRQYDALGGLDRIKARTTMYVEGKIDLVGTGLTGTVIQWNEFPMRSRQQVDLTIITQVDGDNGRHRWSVDQNGKVQVRTDDQTLKSRRIDSLMAVFEHLNRDSEFFVVTYDGLDTAVGRDCYVVTISNTVNRDTLRQLFDTVTFRELKSVAVTPDGTTTTWYSDYRPVGDFTMSFAQRSLMEPTGMVQTFEISKLEFNGAIDPALFEPPGEDVQDFVFDHGGRVENLPFELIENHIYLPVTVGGKERLWVLDTGAGATVIEKKFADELGLESQGNFTGSGAGNTVEVSFTDLPPLELPGLRFESQKAIVIDLQGLFVKSMGFEIAGILGFDFLSRLVTKVDFAAERISFYHPDSFSYSGPGVVIDAPLTAKRGFNLPLTIDGEYDGMWFLDLGANGMSFHYPYAEERELLGRPGVTKRAHGAGGAFDVVASRFRKIELAGFAWENPIIDVPVQRGPGAFGGGELAGNIGNTLMRRFVLYLDYKREQVIIEKGADYSRVFPEAKSGLQFMYDDNGRLEATFVAEGTPAAKAGLQEGDLLISVNGIPVELFDGPVALRTLFKGEAGEEFLIEFDRNGASKTAGMTLRYLYD